MSYLQLSSAPLSGAFAEHYTSCCCRLYWCFGETRVMRRAGYATSPIVAGILNHCICSLTLLNRCNMFYSPPNVCPEIDEQSAILYFLYDRFSLHSVFDSVYIEYPSWISLWSSERKINNSCISENR